MNRKERGELSELAFIYKASGLGFHVSKPYGDSSPYDCIVEHLGRLSKVQVKSTTYLHAATGGYQVNSQRVVSGTSKCYCAGDLDYFAFHIAPRDVWYIVPYHEVGGNLRVLLHADKPERDRRFGRYREAWHLLEGLKTSNDVLLTFSIDACEEQHTGHFSTSPAFSP